MAILGSKEVRSSESLSHKLVLMNSAKVALKVPEESNFGFSFMHTSVSSSNSLQFKQDWVPLRERS